MNTSRKPFVMIAPESRPAEGYHLVSQGEWVSKIAARYGIVSDWLRVWNHPLNSELRQKRKEPNVICPGDRLFIPELETRKEDCATNSGHHFVLKSATKKLKFVLRDWEDKPRAGIPCRFEVDKQACPGVVKSDGQGRIEIEIPEGATEGRLLVGGHPAEIYPVMLGHLDPIDEISGYQQRLTNLGYYQGPIDGIDGPATKAATWSFQEYENAVADSEVLKVDGIMGPKTKAKLQERHGY